MQETEKRRREEETRMWALILQHLLVTWPWTSFPISLILTKCKLILDPLLTPSPVTNLEKSNWKRKAAKSVLISNKFTLPVNTGNSSFDGGVCVCVCVCVCVRVCSSVVSDSLWPSGLLPARLLCQWDSPDKNDAFLWNPPRNIFQQHHFVLQLYSFPVFLTFYTMSFILSSFFWGWNMHVKM